ncbi:E3 SUMO-protein ligase KIAA1586-like, partial [Aphis craccivora]
MEKKTKSAELRIAMFITEHNIARRTSDHLVSLIKTIYSDCSEPDVIKNIKCNRTNATALINNAVDESTNKSSIKSLAIVVRLMHMAFLMQLQMSLKNIPIAYKTNMVGFASDGANTMFGSHHSVKTLLQNDFPHLFVMKCICHSLALCASYASSILPYATELKEFQVFVELKPHKLLQPSQTRLLSLHLCVKRILE